MFCFLCGTKPKITQTHRLPCAKGAPAKRVRDCLESTKSVKIHSRLCGTNPLPAEPQHPSVACGDSSPLKKRAAFAGTNCGAEKEKCADFQFRELLPSRSRVPPSSRRKAHSDQLRCRRKEKCEDLRFWSFNFCSCFLCGTKPKIALTRGFLETRGSCEEGEG